MNTKVLSLAVFGILASLTGCNKPAETPVSAEPVVTTTTAETTTDTTTAAPPMEDLADTVIVYSSRNEQLIRPLLDEFTAETGVKVELVSDKGGPLMERLKAEGANTPADMLLTVDAGNLWKATQDGLLEPYDSTIVDTNVPTKYRDPQGNWAGMSLRARTIFYNPNKVQPSELSSYEDLADPKWKDRLCLRTSGAVYNQSLVAGMIEHLGEQKAEEVVKGWVANLATEPFSNDTKMLEVISAGQCDVGIANSYYYGRKLDEDPNFGETVNIFWANQGTTGTHMNVSGAGVVKGANNKAGAVQLMEWLSSDKAQEKYAASDKEFPVKDGVKKSELLASWGDFDPDTIDVSVYGSRQVEAVQLMDRAGFK